MGIQGEQEQQDEMREGEDDVRSVEQIILLYNANLSANRESIFER